MKSITSLAAKAIAAAGNIRAGADTEENYDSVAELVRLTLQLELEDQRRVLLKVIDPADEDTPILAGTFAAYRTMLAAFEPFGEIVSPWSVEDVVDLVLTFLDDPDNELDGDFMAAAGYTIGTAVLSLDIEALKTLADALDRSCEMFEREGENHTETYGFIRGCWEILDSAQHFVLASPSALSTVGLELLKFLEPSGPDVSRCRSEFDLAGFARMRGLTVLELDGVIDRLQELLLVVAFKQDGRVVNVCLGPYGWRLLHEERSGEAGKAD